jgi:hypothetical protein
MRGDNRAAHDSVNSPLAILYDKELHQPAVDVGRKKKLRAWFLSIQIIINASQK